MRLHHVGVLIRNITESAEQYCVRFGYERRSEVIHDPLQSAYVQFLTLAGDSVLLELISPDGPESHLANALNKSGGVHHICYAVVGIEAECEALRSKGMTLVRPPTVAVAFQGRRVAWLMGRDRTLIELVEEGSSGEI